MKTLIAYSTRHGCTEKFVKELENVAAGEVDIINLKKSYNIDLNKYETVIIGGSIHAGSIQKEVKRFCSDNLDVLREKKVGLFICCMEQADKAAKQLREAFPSELLNHAEAAEIFGGEFNFEKMNFIERFIVKRVAGVDKSVSKFNKESFANFVREMKLSKK